MSLPWHGSNDYSIRTPKRVKREGPPPKKKKKKNLLSLGVFVAVVVLMAIEYDAHARQ